MDMDMDMDMDMHRDMRLRPCTSVARNRNDVRLLVDRLSNLPDELLIRILSLLPTKDAAATCVLSPRLRRVLPRLTSLDFDSKPICFCLERSYRVEKFPSFVTFVDTVLQAHQSQYLTRFRLAVGADFVERYDGCDPGVGCLKGCYPDLKSTYIDAWISIPLNRFGLRELDLRIPAKERRDSYQLPPEIFTCETLEVLKLDTDLRLDRASTMPSFHLPNLKQLELYAFSIPDDGFLPRLIASCPLLEDLTVEAYWNRVYYINISSPSLRRLSYNVFKLNARHDADNVLIDTPNLEYLEYTDELALQYSISNMECLVKAHVSLARRLRREPLEVSCRQMIRLIRPLSNVQHLVLRGISTEVLNCVEVVDQLPVFHNLKRLELQYSANYWDKVLLAFLKCSPVLETLAFPWGMVPYEPLHGYNSEQFVLERKFCRTTQAVIPSCCRYHLKRILVKVVVDNERVIDLIQFLLRHALVLEELIIFLYPLYASIDRMEFESTLQNLPRASINCSIRVQDEPF